MRRFRIGVDLGGTKTAVAVLNADSETLFARRRPTPNGNYDRIVETIADLVAEARRETGFEAGAPVGVGIPGALERAGGAVKNANTQALIGRPLAQDLTEALGAAVIIENDANCFIASEAADGAAAGAEIAFGVILGTGVGGGVAIQGRPIAGANLSAGEWGHNPFPNYSRTPTNHRCYCGKFDCIETILSGPALARDFQAATGRALTAAEVAARAEDGEAAAQAMIAEYAENLARALSSVINILDPEVIVLGGGLSGIDALYDLAPKHWDRFIFNAAKEPRPVATRLVKNRWGDDSGVRGAAWLTSDL